MTRSLSPAARITLFLSIAYAGMGAILPYLPVWLEEARGLAGAQIGLILASANISRIVIGPLLAAWADGRKDRRTPLVFLAAAALASYAAMGPDLGFWALAAAGFAAGVLYQGMLPLMEAAAVRITQRGTRLSYGVARGMASAAFIAANVAAGALLQQAGPWGVYAWIVGCCAALFAASLILPREATGLAPAPFLARLRAGLSLLKEARFVLLIFGAGLIQAAHAFYYGFGSLVWIGQSIAESLIGWLWALGVAAEIVFLVWLSRWSERFRPETLIAAGGAAAVVRWTLCALAPPLAALIALQALHALTFGATHLGTMRLLQAWYGDARAPTAQMIYSAVAMAPVLGAATYASGRLYDAAGAAGYLLMTALALAGLALTLALRARGRRARPTPPP